VPLEERVPELIREDLDFVKLCLAADPLKRPKTKDLLCHTYLSIDRHAILKRYEDTVAEAGHRAADCIPTIKDGSSRS
jgi:hypothetical protein